MILTFSLSLSLPWVESDRKGEEDKRSMLPTGCGSDDVEFESETETETETEAGNKMSYENRLAVGSKVENGFVVFFFRLSLFLSRLFLTE